MPFADARNKPWVLEQLRELVALDRIGTVVDVGAGGGANLEFYGPWMVNAKWLAVEAWEPYIERFVLSRYAAVVHMDARELDFPTCDLVFLGDVLEHMAESDGRALWQRARKAARFVVLSLPIVHYEQGAWGGNPFEEHRHHWTTEDVLTLDGIVAHRCNEMTGAFIACDW